MSAQGDVTFHVNAAGDLVLSNMRIGPIDAAIGPVGITGLELAYTGATREWRGDGEAVRRARVHRRPRGPR